MIDDGLFMVPLSLTLTLVCGLTYALARGNNVVAARQCRPPVAEPDELRFWACCFTLATAALIAALIFCPQ